MARARGDEMVERVARAIADANMENYEELKELHDALARAAIAAMREPTEAMLNKGACADVNSGEYRLGDETAQECWQLMIDAVLNDPPR